MIETINTGIYKIVNIINNKLYVGSSVNLKNRKKFHFITLKNNKHCNKHLQNSYNKYGKDNFLFEIVEYVEYNEDKKLLKKILLQKEQYWIDNLIKDNNNKNIGYNDCLIAGSCLGRKLTVEHKQKLSKSKLGEKNPQYGRIYTDEEKEILREYSLNMSKEAREKISRNSKGNKYRLNSTQSEETRKKISISNKGKTKGYKRSDETRKKISEAGKNRIVSDETRNKKKISMTGKKRTKREVLLRLITIKREIVLEKDTKIYCFSTEHAAHILNVDYRTINKVIKKNTKCKGYKIYLSNDDFYKKDILLNNMELFDDNYIPTDKLIILLKNN